MKTHYLKERPESIQEMFSTIAKGYDRTNALLSFNMHRLWNRALIKEAKKSFSGATLLDLCSGTGEIAAGILKDEERPKVAHLLDFCKEMLQVAEDKFSVDLYKKHDLHIHIADAQKIPLKDESVDIATVAYGIRNIKEPACCLAEVHRVLKPGGFFGILELTQPTNTVLRLGHTFYLKRILPVIGKIATKNRDAYDYLCCSIPTFVSPDSLAEMMLSAGFKSVKSRPLTGGIATLLTGFKS